MRRAALVGLVAALLVARPAPAEEQPRPRVSIDWRNVRDSDIQRCGLSRLRAGTLERLVDEGYAVVDSADSTGVRVRVSSVVSGLWIAVQGRRTSREETLPLPANCDATLVLEAISRIADLVRAVGEHSDATSSVASPATPADDRYAPHRGDARSERAAFQLSLDAAAKIANPRDFLLFGGGIALDWAVAAGWRLGARAEIAGNSSHDVTVLEASTTASAGWQPARSGFGLCLEVGPLLHIGQSEQLSARELDAMAGAGPSFSAGPLRAQLLAYARLRRFEHRMNGEVAFDTGQLGLILRIGVQLFDS